MPTPGASYLRTDRTCPSLRAATEDGNPIYAVFTPAGSTEAEVCNAVRAAGNAYGKWLNSRQIPVTSSLLKGPWVPY